MTAYLSGENLVSNVHDHCALENNMSSCIKQTGTCYVCGDIHDYRVPVDNSAFYV